MVSCSNLGAAERLCSVSQLARTLCNRLRERNGNIQLAGSLVCCWLQTPLPPQSSKRPILFILYLDLNPKNEPPLPPGFSAWFVSPVRSRGGTSAEPARFINGDADPVN